ncbi:MAG: hypothetical protein QM765_13535 [Myxococcales bacterium]
MACSSSTPCGQGSYLDCLEGTCRAAGDVGQECGVARRCKLDLCCDAGTWTCRERVAPGQPCDALAQPCTLGFVRPTDTKECVQPEVGQACGAVTWTAGLRAPGLGQVAARVASSAPVGDF